MSVLELQPDCFLLPFPCLVTLFSLFFWGSLFLTIFAKWKPGSGNPEHPHQRKHAFDLSKYRAGYITNSLALRYNYKGAVHYLDAEFLSQNGGIRKIKNAIYIHKEDTGILFKHTDFRNESSIMTQARILVIQQVFTAANYEYAIRVCSNHDFHDLLFPSGILKGSL